MEEEVRKENSEFSNCLVKLFNDLAKKRNVLVSDLDLSLIGDKLCVNYYLGDDMYHQIETINISEL